MKLFSGSGKKEPRRAVALMVVLVTLALLGMVMTTITWQIMAHRRLLEQRQNQHQSAWLARAGVERAIARLLENPAYAGETIPIIPHSQVLIVVKREKASPDLVQVSSEARFPSDVPRGVVRVISRHLRRVVAGNKVRLEVVNNPKDPGVARPRAGR